MVVTLEAENTLLRAEIKSLAEEVGDSKTE
jgi:hypothetical protein